MKGGPVRVQANALSGAHLVVFARYEIPGGFHGHGRVAAIGIGADRLAEHRHKQQCAAEAELEGNGRLVIRPSGTEPVIRVMAEGDDAAQVENVVDRICDAVRSVA